MSGEFWSFLGTVIVGLLAFAGTYTSNKKATAIWQYRVQQLEEKQDKHNQTIERTFALEKGQEAIKRDVKTAFDEIGDVKKSVAKIEDNMVKLGNEIHEIREKEVQVATMVHAYHGGN